MKLSSIPMALLDTHVTTKSAQLIVITEALAGFINRRILFYQFAAECFLLWSSVIAALLMKSRENRGKMKRGTS
ncbi:hypothetical protein QQF64_032824 [Cirrhinus molitorella]|uniref:Uncharacterized protein n=1 Tax=Cirrhinus molitorella TaxID=172907 RepID=A0ABR3MS44_9TELE